MRQPSDTKAVNARILFVDDEPALLQMYAALIQRIKPDWKVWVAHSGKDALALAAHNDFDVVVSDMRMPEMNGAQLLSKFRQLHPRTIRIVLSAYADHTLVIEAAGTVHQWLSKPCTAINLCNTIERAIELERRLTDEKLKNLIVQIGSLPSLPRWYYRILEELNTPTASLEEIGELIACDIGMTLKLLQMVNSAYFGLAQKINHPTEAVQILGMGTVRALALSIHVFSCFSRQQIRDLNVEALWRRGLEAGLRARQVVEAEQGDRATADAAYTAGLLRETGRLILTANLPALYHKACVCAAQEAIPIHEAELKCIGVTHADVGACMLGLWGLPEAIVEAVAWQYTPDLCPNATFNALTAVHFVSTLEYADLLHPREIVRPRLSTGYLERIRCLDRIEAWTEACLVEAVA